jgi:hypothetical protein
MLTAFSCARWAVIPSRPASKSRLRRLAPRVLAELRAAARIRATGNSQAIRYVPVAMIFWDMTRRHRSDSWGRITARSSVLLGPPAAALHRARPAEASPRPLIVLIAALHLQPASESPTGKVRKYASRRRLRPSDHRQPERASDPGRHSAQTLIRAGSVVSAVAPTGPDGIQLHLRWSDRRPQPTPPSRQFRYRRTGRGLRGRSLRTLEASDQQARRRQLSLHRPPTRTH